MATSPRLTFFVELPADRLVEVLQPATVGTLARRGAAVSMALLDLDPERAAAILALTAAGVPVTGWLVLPEADGYWLNADNADQALTRWQAVQAWAETNGLALPTIGLDVEPPHDDTVALVRAPVATAWRLLRRRRPLAQVATAQAAYAHLSRAIAATGREVEAYQVPLLADERAVACRVLARTLGLIDVAADRDVWMLYRSALPRPWGPGLVGAYGAGTRAIAVGITGGGVRSLQPAFVARELDLAATLDELRRAAQHCDDLYVFSLEGCVRRGMLTAICAATLQERPARTSLLATGLVHCGRAAFRMGLRIADRLP